MSYQDQLKKHLTSYKLRTLGISEPGIFHYRGKSLLQDHILPVEHTRRNLLPEAEPFANAFFKDNPRKRHRYFHHLNSSQAFAFNLFVPYFLGTPECASALLRALGEEGTVDEWELEGVPDPEEGTNIDASWKTSSGTRTLCEVKLSEADFGKATDDSRHRAKFNEIYLPVLASHLTAERLEPRAFFAAYQFNRNVWHMALEESNRLVFLVPRSNTVLWRLLQELLTGVVLPSRERISAIAIEDVIARLLSDQRCPPVIREYAMKLQDKYLF